MPRSNAARYGHLMLVPPDPVQVALRFNECITAGDVDALTELMSNDHTFVDTEGEVTSGRGACRDVWRGFFDAFPGYHNTFTSVTINGESVVMTGFSTGSVPALSGPALWSVIIRGDRVAQWRVWHDTPGNRAILGSKAR